MARLFAASEPVPLTVATPARPWSCVATLSYVATTGNAEGKTLGCSNDYTYRWKQSTLVIKAGLLRVSSVQVNRYAMGPTLPEAIVYETRTPKTTTENYYLNARSDHRLARDSRWYWFSSLGWERNHPAALEGRYAGSAGFGRMLVDANDTKLRADLGLGYTRERPTVEIPGKKVRYGTLACNTELKQRLGPNAFYTFELGGIENISDTADLQLNVRQNLSAALNKTLALKVGHSINYRRRPNYIAQDAYSSDGTWTYLGQIMFPARRIDTYFTTSLVATF